jgi:DNA-directed RNA polymerase subunit RPC12/RpoP
MSAKPAKKPHQLGAKQSLCKSGFMHDPERGSVECPHCGSRAFSRKPQAIQKWEDAHIRSCWAWPKGKS